MAKNIFKGKVLRISDDAYSLLEQLRKELTPSIQQTKNTKRKATFTEVIENYIMKSKEQDKIFVVGDKCFNDVLIARGHAIQESVKNKQKVEWPTIYTKIGEDSL